MRLSHLLRIEKGDTSLREGKVLHLIAKAAVKVKHHSHEFQMPKKK